MPKHKAVIKVSALGELIVNDYDFIYRGTQSDIRSMMLFLDRQELVFEAFEEGRVFLDEQIFKPDSKWGIRPLFPIYRPFRMPNPNSGGEALYVSDWALAHNLLDEESQGFILFPCALDFAIALENVYEIS